MKTKKALQKPRNRVYAVIQFKKSGVCCIYEFSVPESADENEINKILYEHVLDTRHFNSRISQTSFTQLGRLPAYWIHFLEVKRLRSNSRFMGSSMSL
jgi:hypothetical protein